MKNTLKEKIDELNSLIVQGKAMEGFEKFYDPDVVMQENEMEPIEGKEKNRQREEQFFANVTEFRTARPLNVAIGDPCTMVEWHLDYTHKEWGVRNYKQVAVQEWKNGKIVKETFYYSA